MKSDYYYSRPRPEILNELPRDQGRVLDVGCAAGFMGEELKKSGAAHVAGIEIVPEVAREAEKRMDEVICGDIEEIELPFPPDSFDTIICADVLEHLKDPWAVMKKLSGVLKPEKGLMIVCIPNVAHYSVFVPLLAGVWKYEEMGILDETHLRFFTASGAGEMIRGAGLELEKVLPVTIGSDEELAAGTKMEFLKKDVLKIVNRFIKEEQSAIADNINVDQYFIYEYLLFARKPASP
ncbi:class I SAM-dependent methyltransferase [bacterium]